MTCVSFFLLFYEVSLRLDLAARFAVQKHTSAHAVPLLAPNLHAIPMHFLVDDRTHFHLSWQDSVPNSIARLVRFIALCGSVQFPKL